jgi:hypothetical protein
VRLAALVLAAFPLACTATPSRLSRYRAMSPESQAAYDKYNQFLTESQQEKYLSLPTDRERQEMLAGLHIEERLAKYPQYIQDAIWSREVVPGMDKAAVLLTWGQPTAVERDFLDDSKGVMRERWVYRRGSTGHEDYQVLLVEGLVQAVDKP